MTNLKLLGLFLLTGLLLAFSFPATGSLTFLVFFALIPLFIAGQIIFDKRLRARKVLWLSYPGFVVFNAITTWWIMNASMGGMLMAVFVNAFVMSVYVWVAHLFHRRYGNYWGYAAFASLWMTFEYVHYHWELSWPWLNLGNVFAVKTTWVQWYEYTGVGGGTLWILLVNITGFQVVRSIYFKNIAAKKNLVALGVWLGLIFIPLIISAGIYSNYTEKKDPIDVVVVQPNINPYGDKFQYLTAQDQMIIFLRNAFSKFDPTTDPVDYIVGPETALPYSMDEDSLYKNDEVKMLQRILAQIKKTSIVTGMSSDNFFLPNEKAPDNAKEMENTFGFYPNGTKRESYNSALFLKADGKYEIYHKSKLVLGVEKIPFSKWLPFLESFALDMGGSVGTLGIEKEPKIFSEKGKRAKIAPAVCYESIYGEYMGRFMQKGGNVIFTITNDGWWGDTPGYHQHLNLGRLTCISLRRSMAQSANTGISAFIDQRGDIIKQTKWWVPTALRSNINLNDELTFYAAHGDVLYRISAYFSLIFVLLYLYAYVMGKQFVNRREV